jgi:hypothetical protein
MADSCGAHSVYLNSVVSLVSCFLRRIISYILRQHGWSGHTLREFMAREAIHLLISDHRRASPRREPNKKRGRSKEGKGHKATGRGMDDGITVGVSPPSKTLQDRRT